MAKLEWHDFGRKKDPKNSIVYPTLNTYELSYGDSTKATKRTRVTQMSIQILLKGKMIFDLLNTSPMFIKI